MFCVIWQLTFAKILGIWQIVIELQQYKFFIKFEFLVPGLWYSDF